MIWHFQGSGKSLLMVFAAQKLRKLQELKSPTVIVLVDRTDLDTQISGTFNAADVANVEVTENIRDLRYKLRMMGITVDEPAFVFGDNQSVLANTTAPSSTLKKKSNAIAYHFVREGCARDEWRTTYINTNDNVADLLTKPLAGPKRSKFVGMLLHHYV